MVAVIVAGGIVLLGALTLLAGPNTPRAVTQPGPPKDGELRRVVAALPGPVFWFGRRTEGQPLTGADEYAGLGGRKTVSFTYGMVCRQLDHGSGPDCPYTGEVSTSDRQPSSLSTARAACWRAVGRAWIIDCPDEDTRAYGPRLLTGRRVVRFSRSAPGDGDLLRPWRQTIGQLQRYGQPGRGAVILTPTQPATAAEFSALGRKARAALPTALRP